MIPSDTPIGSTVWLVSGLSWPLRVRLIGHYDSTPILASDVYQYRGFDNDMYTTEAEANVEAARRFRREARRCLERVDKLEAGERGEP